ncbi:hypothetical protein MJG53_009166 [Ovis ammon polii x Ovis aries]|uniref:Uncharacterized protein n=1 Tax=Ovis ammon polii x Ovis aries TaxID=2918886 RepID=A0ACB9UZJ8_9CETA|nr:hypothetical protein MJT46_008803 [Ovis ammon polii x Ovis aries]KAI4582615.1 hypothetical protein MJG53_009166 [Ovis ammon polii x Ovis aries]
MAPLPATGEYRHLRARRSAFQLGKLLAAAQCSERLLGDKVPFCSNCWGPRQRGMVRDSRGPGGGGRTARRPRGAGAALAAAFPLLFGSDMEDGPSNNASCFRRLTECFLSPSRALVGEGGRETGQLVECREQRRALQEGRYTVKEHEGLTLHEETWSHVPEASAPL